METYTSGQLTIDTQHPGIYVSGLQADSANKEEPYGFTLTVSDSADNLLAGDIAPVLTAVTCDESGNYTTQEVELPAPEMTENQQSYQIQVENLEADGIYTLSCKAKDMADQEYDRMTLEDGQEYETVTFSVNRNGSTFRVDEDTADLLDQYYVYQVPQDVVIEEINTDPIEHYAVTMDGKVLTEGSDYTTNVTSADGTWSVRTYAVKKVLFAEEGEYHLVVESVDEDRYCGLQRHKKSEAGLCGRSDGSGSCIQRTGERWTLRGTGTDGNGCPDGRRRKIKNVPGSSDG